jgi:hypothetical protein
MQEKGSGQIERYGLVGHGWQDRVLALAQSGKIRRFSILLGVVFTPSFELNQ